MHFRSRMKSYWNCPYPGSSFGTISNPGSATIEWTEEVFCKYVIILNISTIFFIFRSPRREKRNCISERNPLFRWFLGSPDTMPFPKGLSEWRNHCIPSLENTPESYHQHYTTSNCLMFFTICDEPNPKVSPSGCFWPSRDDERFGPWKWGP